MEKTLKNYLVKVEDVVKHHEGFIIMVGILPTIRRSDLNLENLTPLPRYQLLNEVLNKLRGGQPYEFRIEGTDELMTKHNSIMFEGCNTSFQVHLQVSPDVFVNSYNWAQAIAGPVLAAATNSPMLLGKRLWQETRVALFQQSVDTRRASYDLREKSSRVTFGNQWVKKSITEIFQGDMARYRVLIGAEIKENSLEMMDKGEIPTLQALQMHNGTVYRWNRPCYGITDGKPHIRIENRILPAGPTVADEIANAAFWLGLMNGISTEYSDIASAMDFDDAKRNFFEAARTGLETQFRWVKGKMVSADELILKELLPISKSGLEKVGIAKNETDHFLGIIQERVKTKHTGSQWILDSCAKVSREGSAKYETCTAITAGIVNRQKSGTPVHKWKPGEIHEAGDWMNRYWKVEHIMVTDLFTVQEDDLVYFASNVMTWAHVRYVPVEDAKGKMVGLLTSRAVLAFHSNKTEPDNKSVSVKEIMVRDPVSVTPETLSIDALLLMRKRKVGCLPVVANGKLVGIITETDFMNFSELTIQRLIQESKLHIKGDELKKDKASGKVSGERSERPSGRRNNG
jgi:CBS domain-containing protein